MVSDGLHKYTSGVGQQVRLLGQELSRRIGLNTTDIATNTHAGDIKATVVAAAPTGWLMLDGSTVTGGQTLHPDLWGVIPAGWKSGADIVLPDARGRALIGAGTGSGLTARALGTVITGAETVTLTAAESGLPAHNHTQNAHTHTQDSHNHTQNAHSHGNYVGWGGGANQLPYWDGNSARAIYGQSSNGAPATPTNNAATATNQNATATNIANSAANAASAHNNMQPSVAFNLMVKT